MVSRWRRSSPVSEGGVAEVFVAEGRVARGESCQRGGLGTLRRIFWGIHVAGCLNSVEFHGAGCRGGLGSLTDSEVPGRSKFVHALCLHALHLPGGKPLLARASSCVLVPL